MSWKVTIRHRRFIDRVEMFEHKADAIARRAKLEARLRRRHTPPMHHVTLERVRHETYADWMTDGVIWGDER